MTSDFLRENSVDFLPYLSHPDTGEMLTEQQFQEYCDQVANTPAWGGQIEVILQVESLFFPFPYFRLKIKNYVFHCLFVMFQYYKLILFYFKNETIVRSLLNTLYN